MKVNQIKKNINQFKKENKVLYKLSIFSFLVIISYYISYDWPEIIPGIDKWYKLITDLCVGVIINLIFYIFQIHIPKIYSQDKAFSLIKRYLNILTYTMVDTILITEKCININIDNHVNIIQDNLYFRRVKKNSKDGKGWCVYIQISKTLFEGYKRNINTNIDKIINNILNLENSSKLI